MTRTEFYRRYAEVVIQVGLNIQPGQELYLRAPIEAAPFVPYLAEEFYSAGGRYVHTEYRHQAVTRARLLKAREDTLTYVPPGTLSERLRVGREGGASLAILGDDPMGLSDVPVARKGPMMASLARASREIKELQMKDHFPWCVISVPNAVWARRVFPHLSDEDALQHLFDAVATACRLDAENPVTAWKEHSLRLTRLAGWLTTSGFDRFVYAAPGTELEVGMPDNQVWIGTEGSSAGGVPFIANLPTDEVFCAPHRLRVNGRVRSTRPLILNGTNVGTVDFTVTDGRITEAHGESHEDVLLQELDLDESARYFGEIALVSEEAPIARMGTTFFDGLYDENAGCHFAFGAAYSNCIRGGAELDEQERQAAGLNQGSQHADFTVGSRELSVTAFRRDGSSLVIMEQGRWSEEVKNLTIR